MRIATILSYVLHPILMPLLGLIVILNSGIYSAELPGEFKNYLYLVGVVSKGEHLALVKKYEELKEKVVVQEETIKHLRMLLEEKKVETQGELVQEFQEIIEKQSEQFQETMETLGNFFKKDEKKS